MEAMHVTHTYGMDAALTWAATTGTVTAILSLDGEDYPVLVEVWDNAEDAVYDEPDPLPQ